MKPLVGNVKLHVSPAPSESSNHPSPGVFIFLGADALAYIPSLVGQELDHPHPRGFFQHLALLPELGMGSAESRVSVALPAWWFSIFRAMAFDSSALCWACIWEGTPKKCNFTLISSLVMPKPVALLTGRELPQRLPNYLIFLPALLMPRWGKQADCGL